MSALAARRQPLHFRQGTDDQCIRFELGSVGEDWVASRHQLFQYLAGFCCIALTLLLGVPVAAGERAPVRSLLELRQERVVMQEWDISCGAAVLATLLTYQLGDPITEREIALGLIAREEYLADPELLRRRQGFSLLDMRRYVTARGHLGIGYGRMSLADLIENAPIIVPIKILGYNHFVIFRGRRGDRVLLADPAWGNRTMRVDAFEAAWIDYGDPVGRVGFVVQPDDGTQLLNRLAPRDADFVMWR
jgi:uncharacterized protein